MISTDAEGRELLGIKDYRPISLLSHMYILFTQILQKWLEWVLDENNQENWPVSEKFTRPLIIFKQVVNW